MDDFDDQHSNLSSCSTESTKRERRLNCRVYNQDFVDQLLAIPENGKGFLLFQGVLTGKKLDV